MDIYNKYRYTFLLSSLLLMLVLIPIVTEYKFISFIFSFLVSYTLFTSILVFSNKSRMFHVSLFLASPYFITNWLSSYFPAIDLIQRINLACGIIFFGFVTIALFLKIFREREVSLEIIFAALSTYLLIGFTWSFIYGLVDSFLPNSFSNIPPELIDPRFRFAYFSFVTLTTLGYGDITPVNNIARSWSILEAIIGQIYLVVVISGLVGIFISKNLQRNLK